MSSHRCFKFGKLQGKTYFQNRFVSKWVETSRSVTNEMIPLLPLSTSTNIITHIIIIIIYYFVFEHSKESIVIIANLCEAHLGPRFK